MSATHPLHHPTRGIQVSDIESSWCKNRKVFTDMGLSFQSSAAANVRYRRSEQGVPEGVLAVSPSAPADLLGFIGQEALAEALEGVSGR